MTDTASSLVHETGPGWAHFTPHLPEVIDDPYPAFRWLRQHAPAFHVVSPRTSGCCRATTTSGRGP